MKGNELITRYNVLEQHKKTQLSYIFINLLRCKNFSTQKWPQGPFTNLEQMYEDGYMPLVYLKETKRKGQQQLYALLSIL